MIVTARNLNAIKRICKRAGLMIVRHEKRERYWIITLKRKDR